MLDLAYWHLREETNRRRTLDVLQKLGGFDASDPVEDLDESLSGFAGDADDARVISLNDPRREAAIAALGG